MISNVGFECFLSFHWNYHFNSIFHHDDEGWPLISSMWFRIQDRRVLCNFRLGALRLQPQIGAVDDEDSHSAINYFDIFRHGQTHQRWRPSRKIIYQKNKTSFLFNQNPMKEISRKWMRKFHAIFRFRVDRKIPESRPLQILIVILLCHYLKILTIA